MNLKKLLSGTLAATIAAAGIAYAATQTLTLGTSTGPGGVLTLFGSTSGSYTISTPAVAGTGTGMVLPPDGGTNLQVLTTNGATPAVATWATVTASASSITPGTTTVVGSTAPCIIDNSSSTVMGCSAVGTGALTALSTNVGSAGAFVVLGGALGTPSSGVGTNITGIVNNNVLATTLATGTSVSLTAPREYYVCTGTCTVTPPVPAAGNEFCVMNDDNVATVITLAALGSSARYEATARTSYGSAGTGTFVSGGAAGDKVCLVGRDSTHYLTVSFSGTWTAN